MSEQRASENGPKVSSPPPVSEDTAKERGEPEGVCQTLSTILP